jgi:hypothetical protein
VIRSPLMPTSARRRGDRPPSIRVPPVINKSNDKADSPGNGSFSKRIWGKLTNVGRDLKTTGSAIRLNLASFSSISQRELFLWLLGDM